MTEEGSILLDYANKILQLVDEAKTVVNPKKWREPLTIGASQTISAVNIPQLLSIFLRENKDISVKVRTNSNQKLEEMLFYGEVDGIFVNSAHDISPFETIYSYYEKIVLISPKRSQLDMLANHTLIVNSDERCVYRKQLLDFSKKSNFLNPNIIEFDSLESILQAVHDGLGISIIPADIAESRKDTQEIQVTELSDRMKVQFIIKNRKQQTQSLKKFIRFLQT